MFTRKTSSNKGFTLIELLVVIAIIGLLASIVLVSLGNARKKGRNAKRAADLKQVQTALELYYNDNNAYPSTSSAYRSQCVAWGSYTAVNVIPGLSPTYISTIPTDPAMDAANNISCYIYVSNGGEYKFIDRNIADMTLADINNLSAFKDPMRNDIGVAQCSFGGDTTISMSIWTNGFRCGF